MFWLIIGVIAAVAILGAAVATRFNKAVALVAAVAVLGGAIGLGSVYTQDPGEAKVIKSISGDIDSVDIDPGFGTTAPWNKKINFELIQQKISYSDQIEGSDGPDITTTDKDGVSANYDVTVTYSINPDENTLKNIYNEYRNQDGLETRLIKENIRSVVRQVPSQYSTREVMSQRGKLEKDIIESLNERFKDAGVKIDGVSLQDIAYPEDVKNRISEAQNAKTDLETAKAQAEKKLIEAKAQADSNRIIEESLGDDILAKQELDAYVEMSKHGAVFVVPEGSTPMVQTQPKG